MKDLGWTIEIEGTEGIGAFDLICLMIAVQTALAVSGSDPDEALSRAVEAGRAMEDPLTREWSTSLKDGRLMKVSRIPVYRN